ncbi:MAG: hypothetical protein ACTHU0_04305 [Kofleriaceae bacterium]
MKRLVVCVWLVGCGGDGGSRGPVELDSLGMELAIASCGKQFDCCTDAEIMQQYMGITHNGEPITTEDQCVAFTNAVFVRFAVEQYRDSIAMGRVEYDGQAAADCITALDSLTCAQYGTGEAADLASACRPFIVAAVADGGGCTRDYECTSDNCVGAIVPQDGPSTDGACEPMPTAGQLCNDHCAKGLYCGYEQSTGMKICQASKADGLQCNLASECTSRYCDSATRTCATKPPTCDGR